MIKLPEKCIQDVSIPKNTFYKRANLNSNVKNEFVNIIEKIVWKYKISYDTINIIKTENVEEIQIFEIKLKEKTIPKNALNIITKYVEYPILFILKFENELLYAMKSDIMYYSQWNDEINFEFSAINLEKLYEKIMKLILHGNTEKSIDEVKENVNKINELEKEIQVVKNKLKKEVQFNKKVELNQKLRKMIKELEELKDE